MSDEQIAVPAVTQMGSTFADRKAAYEAAAKKVEPKQVAKDEDDVEDKAVSSAQTKKRAASKPSSRKR